MKKTTLKDFKKLMSQKDYKGAGKEALEKLTIYKAKEIYGDVLEKRILDRIINEAEELSKYCDVDTILKVVEVILYRKEIGELRLSRLSYNNSLLFYLLGIGNVNPLPKHTYCPKCHMFYWGNKNNELCECCGEKMVEDGYDLPFEPLLDEIRKSGLNFSFSSTRNSKHVTVPIRYFESSLIKLAKELGFTQEDLDDSKINKTDLDNVINCLSVVRFNGGLSYYTKHYKHISICEHQPFIGIDDLSHPVLRTMLHLWEDVYHEENLFKVVNMLHGTGVYDGNMDFVANAYRGNPLSLKNCITSKDELYQFLIKSQLSNDDALLICRETRLCGKGHLSLLSVAKLREAGVEEKYISFMRHISYIFHKGHTVAHTRLAIKLAKIYLEEPLRYYKAYFTLNKEKLLKMDKNYDFVKGLSESKSTDMEEIYLACIDLVERGHDPKTLITDVLNS